MDASTAWIERLRQAVDAHDVEAVVACFAAGYVNETPAHPGRGFTGREQVRTNWNRIFTGVPDLTAEVLRIAVDNTIVWSEWEMSGTRPDGLPHLMRGVIIFEVSDGSATAARFYLEPVDVGEGGVSAAIDRIVGPGKSR